MQAKIEHFIATARDRDFKSALRDADACRESRGTAGKPAEPCDCFCCSLTLTLKRRGWDIPKAAGYYRPLPPPSSRGFGNG